jgi:hypothetical protein
MTKKVANRLQSAFGDRFMFSSAREVNCLHWLQKHQVFQMFSTLNGTSACTNFLLDLCQ